VEQKAVSIFGNKGEVRSVLIIGIENIKDSLKCIETLASLKVSPILSPFRPVKDTPMQNYPFPDEKLFYEIWEESEKIVKNYNLSCREHCELYRSLAQDIRKKIPCTILLHVFPYTQYSLY